MARTELPPTGGEFSLPAVVKPTACPASVAISVPWLKLVDLPNLRFAADPNASSAVREAVVLLSGTPFFVRQTPPPQVGLAAVPSRLVFGIGKNGRCERQIITAWTESPSATVTARAQHSWLVITAKRQKGERQIYEVTIRDDAKLPAGRHDSQIELSTKGSATPSLVIPVVVEVVGKL